MAQRRLPGGSHIPGFRIELLSTALVPLPLLQPQGNLYFYFLTLRRSVLEPLGAPRSSSFYDPIYIILTKRAKNIPI